MCTFLPQRCLKGRNTLEGTVVKYVTGIILDTIVSDHLSEIDYYITM